MSSRTLVWIAALFLSLSRTDARNSSLTSNSDSLHWTSEANLDRFPKSVHGRVSISNEGIDFRPAKGQVLHWLLQDIRTVDLESPRKLSLVTYQNRRWHVPGDRPFDFELKNSMPPEVAAELIRQVGKPAINGVPLPHASSFAIIGARHKTRTGGSSGVLRFSENGIDYLAAKENDSRTWRWADIETLSNPEPYRLRVGGYLETFDFELKQSLPEALYHRLWDHVSAQGLNIRPERGETHAESH